MELRTLRYFTVVAQEKNITRAAELLNMSQPPLSNQMHNLESELGVQLFIRGKRHLQLTEAGSLLLRRANQVLELTDKTRQELREMQDGLSGTISIGMVEGRAPFLVSRWISGFREEFPLVQYSLWNGSSDDVLERLYRGLVDIAVIAAPYDTEHLEGFPVGREPWVALIPVSHPLARQEGNRIPLVSLVEQPLIVPSRRSRVEAIRQWFQETGAEPRIVCSTSNYLDAVAMSEFGVGISIFPQTTYTPNALLVSKVITDSERQVEYVLVRSKELHPSPLVEEFINFIRDAMEDDRRKPVHQLLSEYEYIPPEDTPFL